MKLYASFFSLDETLMIERMLAHFMRIVHPRATGSWQVKVTLIISPGPASGEKPHYIHGKVEKTIPGQRDSQSVRLGDWGMPGGMHAREIADLVLFRLDQFLLSVDGTVENRTSITGDGEYVCVFTNGAWKAERPYSH